MDELEVIYEELLDKHKELYKPEQLRAWAHLLQLKKHDSYEEPPNKPSFRNTRKNKHTAVETSREPSQQSVALSPGKHVSMQGQLIDQMSKIHELHAGTGGHYKGTV